jgi:hypothetical protein
MHNKSESIKELAAAMAKAQAELSNPKKTSSNPFFKSKYADLAEVINASKQSLSAHGLSITQMPSCADGMVTVETMVMHESGEWMSSSLSLPVSKLDAQSIGSATTYARRYGWASVCGLAQEDDDAESAIGRNNAPAKQTKQAKPYVKRETLSAYIDAINEGDNLAFKQLWNEVDRPMQERIWANLNTKEKEIGRALLNEDAE